MKPVTPSWTRILIAAAIALAVPLQGLAAASAGVCMALGHHEAPAMDDHSGHDQGMNHGMDHAQDAADDADSAHCAPCVACCAAAAISPSHAVTVAKTVLSPSLPLAPPSVSRAQPDSLDRPPLAL